MLVKGAKGHYTSPLGENDCAMKKLDCIYNVLFCYLFPGSLESRPIHGVRGSAVIEERQSCSGGERQPA